MYFFQDDIGLLVQHAQNNFWGFLILPQAEHFAPLLHALTYLEFQLFRLNFYGYFFVSLFLHFLNLIILCKILTFLKLKQKLAILISLLFFINLTFVEPFLWFSAQGVILANIFIALTFYFWLKNSPLTFIFLLAASFSFSTGLGLGLIFFLMNLFFGNFYPAFLFLGIISFLIGPLVAGANLGSVTPIIRHPINDLLLFSAFVIGGVGRGVFGRLVLPGFEPRHFETIKTLLSFIPFVLILSFVFKLIIKGQKRRRNFLLSLTVLIIYPYVWAGAIRYQFGIKQALAERYAYTPLFFSVILIGLLLKYLSDKKIFTNYKIIFSTVFLIFILQIFNFYKKAVEFEIRPMQTKKYIEDLQIKIKNNMSIEDTPLPSYINQPLKVSDLYPILKPHK